MQSDTSRDVWRERAVYGLLFLLPVGGISVRHWISTTFTLLVLLSLADVFRRDHRLLRPERTLMFIAAAFFGVFLLTALVNGWADLQTRNFGRELRFLLLIPIYLMVRRYPDAGPWLLRGGIVGGFTLLAQALYDVYVLGMARAQGVYSPNLIGPYAAIVAVLLLVFWRLESGGRWRGLAPASIAAALTAVALSVSRGAYVGLLGMLLVWGGLSFRGRYLAMALAGIAGLVAVGYAGSDRVRDGVNRAMTEVEYVVETDDLAKTMRRGFLSVPIRIEMWRVSWLIFRDNPIFGVGRGNYAKAAGTYVARGEVHREVARHSHPHNAYLEMLISKGIVGLAVFLALLFYPLVVFLQGRVRSPETAVLGAVLIVGFALFSVTDASTFIKGNYISIFVIYSAVLFAWHMRRLGAPDA